MKYICKIFLHSAEHCLNSYLKLYKMPLYLNWVRFKLSQDQKVILYAKTTY